MRGFRRKREIDKTIAKFTCPHCGQLAGCDELGRPGMYSLKIHNRHVQRCQEVLESARAGDAEGAEIAKARLLRVHAGDDVGGLGPEDGGDVG